MEVFKLPLQRRYTAPCCSCAVCLRLLSIVVLVVVPFFLAFSSHSFWLKESLHYEQPKVLFKHQVVVLARSLSAGNEAGEGILYSTIDAGRFVSEGRLRPSITKFNDVDDNKDGKTDSMSIEVTLPLKPGEKIHHLSAFVVLEYMLQDRARVVFESAAFVDYSNPIPGSALEVDGDLVLQQRHTLPYSGSFRKLYVEDPLISDTDERDVDFEDVVRRYAQRNITTAFVGRYPLWTPSLPEGPGGPGGPGGSGRAQSFQLSIRVRIPTNQAVLYTPAPSEMLKFAWVQYLSMLAIVAVVLEFCLNFIFRYQIVETKQSLDRFSGGPKQHQF